MAPRSVGKQKDCCLARIQAFLSESRVLGQIRLHETVGFIPHTFTVLELEDGTLVCIEKYADKLELLVGMGHWFCDFSGVLKRAYWDYKNRNNRKVIRLTDNVVSRLEKGPLPRPPT